MSQPAAPPSLRSLHQVTFFAAINQAAKMADPRTVEPSQEALKAITEALMLARQYDPTYADALEDWVRLTLDLVARIKAGSI